MHGSGKIMTTLSSCPYESGASTVLLCVSKTFTAVSFQIYSLILQGRIKDARELLAQHPDKQPGTYDVRSQKWLRDQVIETFLEFEPFCTSRHILILNDTYWESRVWLVLLWPVYKCKCLKSWLQITVTRCWGIVFLSSILCKPNAWPVRAFWSWWFSQEIHFLSSFYWQAFESIDECLRKMPLYQVQ